MDIGIGGLNLILYYHIAPYSNAQSVTGDISKEYNEISGF